MKFISFGSGSSGNCYYLYTDTDGLLIDIGIGLRTLKKKFRDYGLSLESIHQVIVTHDHADPVKSTGSISHDYHLNVYATRLVHEGINANYCVRHKIDPVYRKVVEPGSTYEIGEFSVTPFTVPHDSTDNVGYRIEHGGVTFCLITDIGHVTDDIRQAVAAANYLVIEANHDEDMLQSGPYPEHLKRRILGPKGHLSNRDCAETLAQNATPNLRHVWLCHLSEENNHPELARKTVESVLKGYGIITGKDFALDVLGRKTTSNVFELK